MIYILKKGLTLSDFPLRHANSSTSDIFKNDTKINSIATKCCGRQEKKQFVGYGKKKLIPIIIVHNYLWLDSK